MNKFVNEFGWNFDNSYVSLPDILMTKIKPDKINSPKLEILNKDLVEELNLNFNLLNKKDLSLIFSGNKLPMGSECIAQAYAGHQFGYFTMLGDGRAVLIGEHINHCGKRYDIQFKGSGKTPYSRKGDGKATLDSMLREFLISEAIYRLKIPTSRSLALVSTGEDVYREKKFKGAILTRVASSHIRIGTFQFLASKGDIATLKKLIDYTIKRHYSFINDKKNYAIRLLENFMTRQISLIIDWMRVGFIHGVMNTDNMTLSGETIDFGPCAFMDQYNPNTVFSSIDHQGRYSFNNQEIICHWNVSRFAETLIPFFSNNQKNSLIIGNEIINTFKDIFKNKWLSMMKNKLGFQGIDKYDIKFIDNLLKWMHQNNADYTNTFLYFMNSKKITDSIYNKKSFIDLYNQWKYRINKNSINQIETLRIMQSNNPQFIPRNYLVEDAINEVCENNNYLKFNKILKLIKNPYSLKANIEDMQKPPSLEFNEQYKTFCGT